MKNTQTTSHLLEEIPLITPTETTCPCVVRAADASYLEIGGERTAFKLPSSQTAGRVTVASTEVAVNAGPPTHIHTDAEEIFLIQSGAFELMVNGELVEARAGDVAYMARGEAHRFRALDSGQPNLFNLIVAPGGFEHFINNWSTRFQNEQPNPQSAAQLCGEHNITLFPSDDVAPVAIEPQTRVIPAGKKPLSVFGTQVSILLTAADTQERYSLVRIAGEVNSGPPLHIHKHEDELFLIESGRVEFTLGKENFVAEAGDVVWGPRGWPHTFRLASEGARMAIFMTPGGFDDFFVESALTEIAGDTSPATLIALAERFGMTYLFPSE